MDINWVNVSEALVLASFSYGEVMSMFLALLPARTLLFYLAVTLIIGSINDTKLKVENRFGPLPPLYLLWDETSFCHKLKERYTKTVKDYEKAFETDIWDNVTSGVAG